MRFPSILLLACCLAAHAMAAEVPVTEIRLQTESAQKVDFAYQEMQRAEWNQEAAEREAAEAERALQQAQRQADEAALRQAAARKKVETTKAAAQQARKRWEGLSRQLPAGQRKP